MNKEEIIRMAKQAGFERLGHDEHDYVCYPDDIVAFAELVASAVRKKDRENALAYMRMLHDSFSLASDASGLRDRS